MSRQPSPSRSQKLQQALKNLSQIKLDEIDFKNAGSWPRAGKVTAWAVTALVTLIVGYWFYIAPKQDALQQAQQEEQQLLGEFEIKAFQGANLEAYKKQMQTIQQKISTLSSQLPTEKSVPALIEQIGDQAQLHRVDIRGLKLQPETSHEAYNAQPILISVSGYYHNIARFLAGLTQLQRIVTLHDFTLIPDSKQLSLEIQARAYHNPDREQPEQGGADE